MRSSRALFRLKPLTRLWRKVVDANPDQRQHWTTLKNTSGQLKCFYPEKNAFYTEKNAFYTEKTYKL